MTYAELHRAAIDVTRAAMAVGLRPGDRAAIWAPNSARWIVTALGLLGAGAVLVPVGTRLRGPEAAEILARTRCRALFTVRGFLGIDYLRMLDETGCELRDLETCVLFSDSTGDSPTPVDGGRSPAVPRGTFLVSWSEFIENGCGTALDDAEGRASSVAPEAISDILFTSGTTGAPKGVLATHQQTLAVFHRWATVVTLRHGDRYLLVNPFSHTFGYKAGIIACLLRAATMVPVDRFDPRRFGHTIERERITVLAGPPTLFGDLLESGQRWPTVRLAGTGGAAIPVSLVERMRRDLGIPQVFTAYGLTESVGVVAVCPPDAPAELVATTVGKRLPDSEIRIVGPDGEPMPPGTPGEIVVRGPNVMHGYLDDPDATADAIDAAGWLHTGDIGVLDGDGYLSITDRLKDMFIVGGFNAYPAEIERILLRHPDIRDAAVVGVPDPRLGEVGVAFLVPADPARVDASAILDWARTRLAGYKVPRGVRFVDALPRNTGGKVRKNELRSLLADSERPADC
ncbi:acyl-CoA synthetase (AMP-forming)/AMP-acid ligase II [Nocardia mexicana]|uniref:Acyl-CoA synthetase (AMP-forming)/AMP-acid ligase II n=2 Tax=Nocardia mexicana TaxID=279262 RepID=A0A370HD37_9NOCA|nr:acyl-CoA synthetase (AMP-forming)/AMP-acid ligase II [Nocardia mexicana]